MLDRFLLHEVDQLRVDQLKIKAGVYFLWSIVSVEQQVKHTNFLRSRFIRFEELQGRLVKRGLGNSELGTDAFVVEGRLLISY